MDRSHSTHAAPLEPPRVDLPRVDLPRSSATQVAATLVDLMPAAVYTCDAEGRITYFNQRAVELWGRAPKIQDPDIRFCGSLRLFYAHGGRLPHERTPMALALQHGKPYHDLEVIIERPDGSRVTVLVNIDPLFDEQGVLTGAVNVFQDISDRKRAEAERERLLSELEKERASLRELTATLETRIAQRTEQVRQLASMLTLAEQRERARISQVLHDDLQQLLYSQLMRMELLRQDLPREQRVQVNELLASMNEQLEQAVRITRALTAELNPPGVKDGDLNEALHWLAAHMEETHGIKVSVTSDVTGVSGRDDTCDLLLQMVRELLFNVVKHARTDSASVHLSRSNGFVTLSVSDQGAGFRRQDLARRPGDQEGLGLFSISNRLQLIGGRLEIQSSPGEGARLTIQAPMDQ